MTIPTQAQIDAVKAEYLNLCGHFKVPSDATFTALAAAAYIGIADEIERLRARAERLRLELEKIAWMDEFLDADGARAMMNIAREAVNVDEQ